MDERLGKALDYSNLMVTINNHKRFLQENFYQDIIFYYKGGQFTVNKELLCFCEIMKLKNQQVVILIDDNDMPVEIDNLEDFNDKIFDLYFSASNKFLVEYNNLKKNKTIEKIINL